MKTATPPRCAETDLEPVSIATPEALAAIAKGLSHPARLQIVLQFRDHRPRMVHEVAAGCQLAQSTVSEHLRILRDAKILFATKDGRRTWYCLRRSVLRAFADSVAQLSDDLVPLRAALIRR